MSDESNINGELRFEISGGPRYWVDPADNGGRGLTFDFVFVDEFLKHENWNAWSALTRTTTARPGAACSGGPRPRGRISPNRGRGPGATPRSITSSPRRQSPPPGRPTQSRCSISRSRTSLLPTRRAAWSKLASGLSVGTRSAPSSRGAGLHLRRGLTRPAGKRVPGRISGSRRAHILPTTGPDSALLKPLERSE